MSEVFSPVAPHFFKIIIDKTLQEKKLLIPKKFVRLYGKSLSNSVCVKVPCGSEWEMEVVEFEGRVWLGKGWERFVEHYSIVKGHMICFRYEGNSRFEALIFDKSTVEIDYPCKGSVENSGDFIARHGKRKKYQSPCSHDGKRRRTGPVDEPKINPCHSKPEGNQDFPSTNDAERKPKPDHNLSENFEFGKHIDRDKKYAAFQKANCFTSDHPSFKVIMQPHYVNKYEMNIPRSFAGKYFGNKSMENAILKVRNGRNTTWPVKQIILPYRGRVKAALSCGWRDFVEGNNLEIGDVCVFVLLKELKDVTYEVVIFRSKEDSKPPNSSGSTKVDCCEKSSPIKPEPGVDIDTRTPMNTDRLRKRAQFVSEKHAFQLFVQPSYTGYNSYMVIPQDIAKKYFKKEGDIILRVPNRRSWSIQFKMWRRTAKLLRGWSAFTEGNNLKAGDVCIFKLIDGNKTSFEVSFIRASKDPHCQQFKEENDSESDGTMKNETSTYNLRDETPILEATRRQRALLIVEKTKFLERAYFKSEEPFFKVFVQPSYTYHMPIPYDFAQKYIKENRDAILRVQDSTRSWPVQFKFRRLKSKRFTAEISLGWKEFAGSNNLGVADVCIFELTNKIDISFNVSIVRAGADDALQRRSQDGESSKYSDQIQRGTKRVKIEVD